MVKRRPAVPDADGPTVVTDLVYAAALMLVVGLVVRGNAG